MLKVIRQDKNYTQKKLADKIGISVQRLSNYENGQRTPDYDITIQIEKALKLKNKEKKQLIEYFAEVDRKRKGQI